MQEFKDVFGGETFQEIAEADTKELLEEKMDKRREELSRVGFEEVRRVPLTERDVRKMRAANKRKQKQKRKQAKMMRRLNGGR